MNLSTAAGHSSFVMSNSFSHLAIAQIEPFREDGRRPDAVVRPRHSAPGCRLVAPSHG